MKIEFRRECLVEETLKFDALYEESLRLDLEEKREDLRGAFSTFLFVDGGIAGEIYGKRVKDLEEEIPDLGRVSPEWIYCYSTTILPQYRGKGLGKILKAFWLGKVSSETTYVVGHSTSAEIKAINEFFGAEHFLPSHKDWFDSGREAWFYKLHL